MRTFLLTTALLLGLGAGAVNASAANAARSSLGSDPQAAWING